ncbi:MAG: PorT family protein [Bryobacterales bacterium]|nr:PorT family protein [Bryobacterales bacterium]
MLQYFRAAGGVVLLAACAVAASAQNQASSNKIPVKKEEKRLSVGFTVGGTITSGVKTVSTSVNTSATTPPTVTDTIVDSKTARYLVGGSLRYDVGERFGVGGDVIYRRGGYNTVIAVSEQITEDEDGDLLLQNTEQTRANLIDIPILGRYYFRPRSDDGARAFVTGGLAMRFVSGLKTTSETTDQDLVTDTDLTAIGPANSFVPGVVIGAGVRAKDDVGVKVDLEFRLTRWVNPVFQSGPANSNPNQAEAMVSFTF